MSLGGMGKVLLSLPILPAAVEVAGDNGVLHGHF